MIHEPIDEYTDFSHYEQDFCDDCGEYLMKHLEGKCPPSRNEFMLEVKRRKAKRYVARD